MSISSSIVSSALHPVLGWERNDCINSEEAAYVASARSPSRLRSTIPVTGVMPKRS